MKLHEYLQNNGLKAVFYGRHSTDEQDVETQRKTCQAFAAKYGIEIIDEYIDENISAFKKSLYKRKSINQMRADAKEGKFDCVLVYHADRLARNIPQHMQLWGEFRELKIPIIITHSEKLYTSDDPNDIIIDIGLSSFESENTRLRTKDHYRIHTQKGKWLGGILPYGYYYEEASDGEKVITKKPIEIERVREVFDLYRQGYGFKRVASKMVDNYPDEAWTREKIKKIITNPFYAGYTTASRIANGAGNSIAPRAEWAMGACDKIPAVIDKALWEECMGIYEEKKHGGTDSSQYITPYLFKDVLYCRACECQLKGKNYQSGKKNKEGIPYGSRRYICSSCKETWDFYEVDSYLIKETLSGWIFQYFSKHKEELQKEFVEAVTAQIKAIDKVIEGYKKELMAYTKLIKTAEQKQRELLHESPEPNELNYALVQYRVSYRKKIDELEKEIEIKEKEKMRLEERYGNKERFMTFILENTNFEYDLKSPKFRQLVLYLYDKIIIGKDINGEYLYMLHAKVDLSQRGEILLLQHALMVGEQDE